MSKEARTARMAHHLVEDTTRRVAIYVRRSADEDHQPFSLEARETKLRAFVASQPGDWQIVAVYGSGASTDRPELQMRSALPGPAASREADQRMASAHQWAARPRLW
jgi:hypothetical protein